MTTQSATGFEINHQTNQKMTTEQSEHARYAEILDHVLPLGWVPFYGFLFISPEKKFVYLLDYDLSTIIAN
jgi:hypothetical protein